MTTAPAQDSEQSLLTLYLAEELRALRARHRATQVELSALLGVSQGQISARMNGHLKLSVDELVLLAERFNTSPGQLLQVAADRAREGGQDSVMLDASRRIESRSRGLVNRTTPRHLLDLENGAPDSVDREGYATVLSFRQPTRRRVLAGLGWTA